MGNRVEAGKVYSCPFTRDDFTMATSRELVAVLAPKYSDDGETVRALVARARYEGDQIKVNLGEIYAVPVNKLRPVRATPLTRQQLRAAHNEVRKLIK